MAGECYNMLKSLQHVVTTMAQVELKDSDTADEECCMLGVLEHVVTTEVGGRLKDQSNTEKITTCLRKYNMHEKHTRMFFKTQKQLFIHFLDGNKLFSCKRSDFTNFFSKN